MVVHACLDRGEPKDFGAIELGIGLLNAPSRVSDDRMRAADPGQRARQIDRHLIRLICPICPICPIRPIRLIRLICLICLICLIRPIRPIRPIRLIRPIRPIRLIDQDRRAGRNCYAAAEEHAEDP